MLYMICKLMDGKEIKGFRFIDTRYEKPRTLQLSVDHLKQLYLKGEIIPENLEHVNGKFKAKHGAFERYTSINIKNMGLIGQESLVILEKLDNNGLVIYRVCNSVGVIKDYTLDHLINQGINLANAALKNINHKYILVPLGHKLEAKKINKDSGQNKPKNQSYRRYNNGRLVYDKQYHSLMVDRKSNGVYEVLDYTSDLVNKADKNGVELCKTEPIMGIKFGGADKIIGSEIFICCPTKEVAKQFISYGRTDNENYKNNIFGVFMTKSKDGSDILWVSLKNKKHIVYKRFFDIVYMSDNIVSIHNKRLEGYKEAEKGYIIGIGFQGLTIIEFNITKKVSSAATINYKLGNSILDLLTVIRTIPYSLIKSTESLDRILAELTTGISIKDLSQEALNEIFKNASKPFGEARIVDFKDVTYTTNTTELDKENYGLVGATVIADAFDNLTEITALTNFDNNNNCNEEYSGTNYVNFMTDEAISMIPLVGSRQLLELSSVNKYKLLVGSIKRIVGATNVEGKRIWNTAGKQDIDKKYSLIGDKHIVKNESDSLVDKLSLGLYAAYKSGILTNPEIGNHDLTEDNGKDKYTIDDSLEILNIKNGIMTIRLSRIILSYDIERLKSKNIERQTFREQYSNQLVAFNVKTALLGRPVTVNEHGYIEDFAEDIVLQQSKLIRGYNLIGRPKESSYSRLSKKLGIVASGEPFNCAQLKSSPLFDPKVYVIVKPEIAYKIKYRLSEYYGINSYILFSTSKFNVDQLYDIEPLFIDSELRSKSTYSRNRLTSDKSDDKNFDITIEQLDKILALRFALLTKYEITNSDEVSLLNFIKYPTKYFNWNNQIEGESYNGISMYKRVYIERNLRVERVETVAEFIELYRDYLKKSKLHKSLIDRKIADELLRKSYEMLI